MEKHIENKRVIDAFRDIIGEGKRASYRKAADVLGVTEKTLRRLAGEDRVEGRPVPTIGRVHRLAMKAAILGKSPFDP